QMFWTRPDFGVRVHLCDRYPQDRPSAPRRGHERADLRACGRRRCRPVLDDRLRARALRTPCGAHRHRDRLPIGYAAFVHPRSGLSSKHGVTVVNAPGTIDAGYRGEIRVPLINLDAKTPLRVARGDRIAQLVIQRIAHADFNLVETLDDSDRGAGGFGSTGGLDAALSEKEK